MAKRFTDTNKYKKPFIRGLKGPYKLLWDYLYHDCDHAGIWIVDFEIAQLYIGQDMPVNKDDALNYFNIGETRIIEIDSGARWFIPSFIDFQYGELNDKNRVHNSVIQTLKKYRLKNYNKLLPSSMQGAIDKDKEQDIENDKDMVIDMDKNTENGNVTENVPVNIEFEVFWNLYDKKVGDKTKLIKKWNHFTDSERQAIIDYIPKYIQSRQDKQFRKDPETFFNKRSWNDEIISSQKNGIDRGQRPGQVIVSGKIPASFKKS